MAKVRYDVSNATPGGDWEHAKPGLYILELESMEHKKSAKQNPMFEMRWKPVAEADGTKLEGDVSSVFYHVLTDGTQDGRLRALTDAMGLKPKGTIDTDAVLGERVLGQLKSDKDQDGEYRPRLAKVMPLPEDSADLEAEDEEGEESEEEDEELDLSSLNRTQLKALIKEHELDIRVLKSTTDDQLREQIAEAFAPEEEAEEPEEEEEAEEEEEDEGVDLSTLSRAQLKTFIKDNELEVRVLKSMSDDDIRNAIAEAAGSGEEEETEEEEEADGGGYTSMQIQQLKNALKERGLASSGTKAALVKRLEADDKKGGDPF